MENLLITGVLFGLALGTILTYLYVNKQRKNTIDSQSVILIDKIKQVCKLITVEGDFSEILTHRDDKAFLFNLLHLEKKALIIVHARVSVGFDFSQSKVSAVTSNKTIYFERFPEPTVLSIETDLEYYDIKKGVINKFSEKDLTNLNKKAKEMIRATAVKSHLMEAAHNQAEETIRLIKHLVEPAGWKLNVNREEKIPDTASLSGNKEKLSIDK
jgi:hypothetical protein